MARLFGKEYHEHSNTWYFKSSAKNFDRSDLTYTKYLDEHGNVVITFRASDRRKIIFPAKVKIIYNKDTREIPSHQCSICKKNDLCSHFLTVINYAYKYLSTDILDNNVIQTYQTNLLSYNEYWQRVLLNSYIQIENIYDTTDKIRIHFKKYENFDLRLISYFLKNKELKKEDEQKLPEIKKQLLAFSNEERELIQALYVNKCSFSKKGNFFTVYKYNFHKIIPHLQALQAKVYIKETGDKFLVSDEPFHLNFHISKIDEENYMMKIAQEEQVSAFFVSHTTYIFKKNVLHYLQLPFRKDVTQKIFQEAYYLKKEDLVYFASVIARQLSLLKCYLDFDSNVIIPDFFDNIPIVTFNLRKENQSIIFNGRLDYSDFVSIPLSVIRFPSELVRFDQENKLTWFYIPPQIKYQVFQFVKKLPTPQTSQLESMSQLLFTGKKEIEELKKLIFEEADPAWNIVLSDELKKEFIYKVTLKPTIDIKNTGEINWFEYAVTYTFQDIQFTHEDLKKFFTTQEKFYKLDDGRLFYFTNTKAFNDVEEILAKSEELKSNVYKLSIYNIPYLYQLPAINQGISIQGDDFLQEMFTAILKRQMKKKNTVPSHLRPIMRSYQKAGFHWLKMLQHYKLGGILADDMGLGKTIQAISILTDLPSNSQSLVICPKTLLYNWSAEITKFNPSLSFMIYEGKKEERIEMLQKTKSNVILASYTIIQNDIEELLKTTFDFIILDEAQHIKNASALRTKAIKKLHGKNKLALTGTPMENSPAELWSIFDFILPGYLLPLRKFKAKYINPIEVDNEKQEHLASTISPFILRRKKKDVLIELPDKQIQISYCKMTDIQEKFYLQILDSVRKKLFPKTNPQEKGNYINVLAALTKLRQICNHPGLIEPNMIKTPEVSGKLEMLKEIIVDGLGNGRKILVFSQFVKTLTIIRNVLDQENITYEYMDGKTKNRMKRVDNFNNNQNVRIFLISLKTGGYGLNLTSADTVIIVDPWWNPMGENQAIDRAHRIGQTKKVMVYKLITKNSVEEKILNLQQNKIEMFENIIEGGQHIVSKLNEDDLRELFEFNVEKKAQTHEQEIDYS